MPASLRTAAGTSHSRNGLPSSTHSKAAKQVLRNVDLQECLAAGTFAVVEWPIGNPNARPFSIGQVAASYVAETALKYFRRSVFCRPMKDRQH